MKIEVKNAIRPATHTNGTGVMQYFDKMLKFLYFSVLWSGLTAFPKPYVGVCSGPYTELLVSPVVEDGIMRRLTIQWEELPTGAVIGVFNEDPSQGLVQPVFTYTPTKPSGWTNTTISEKHVLYSQLGYESRCLGHFIAHRTGADWLGVSCLKTEPTWMWDMKNEISATPLRSLFIPGTHDSSAYREYNLTKPDDLVTKYSVTQDEPVLGQLIYGARYIDLRVGYYPNSKEIWYGNHGVYQFHPMSEILGNITKFLQNTNEFIILDVQEWPVGFGDGDSIHRLFIEYLNNTIGQYIMPKLDSLWDSTVGDIFNFGKRIIVGYDNGPLAAEFSILWPAVEQVWGDKQHDVDLMDYLATVIQRPPSHAWAAMAQLTPSASDIILNTMKGLRHAAEVVNHNVTASFRQTAWAANTNVLAIDFLRGSGAVNAAIQWNSGAGPCQTQNKPT